MNSNQTTLRISAISVLLCSLLQALWAQDHLGMMEGPHFKYQSPWEPMHGTNYITGQDTNWIGHVDICADWSVRLRNQTSRVGQTTQTWHSSAEWMLMRDRLQRSFIAMRDAYHQFQAAFTPEQRLALDQQFQRVRMAWKALAGELSSSTPRRMRIRAAAANLMSAINAWQVQMNALRASGSGAAQ